MNKKQKNRGDNPKSLAPPFHVEAYRSGRGISMVIGGVIGISEYSAESLELLSHGGRISIVGKLIKVGILESNTVEITGKIREVDFKYGKD